VLAAAKSDPAGFIGGLEDPVVIDEVQRVPELFIPIKAAVDRDRRPGRFLLTGSANVLLLPKLSESLAGRMEVGEQTVPFAPNLYALPISSVWQWQRARTSARVPVGARAPRSIPTRPARSR
jgi:hypothetical protein